MKQFFSDKGSYSMMRLLSFICVISASLISLLGIIRGSDLSELAVLCGVFLTTAFAGKAMQRHTESKEPESEK